jgi:hypothetical protein
VVPAVAMPQNLDGLMLLQMATDKGKLIIEF